MLADTFQGKNVPIARKNTLADTFQGKNVPITRKN